jgi:deazaflavin-dependent oxidoreductase (nitroreductase family)
VADAEDALAREIECTLVTRGRTSGEPREVTIWFAAVGRTVYLLSGGGEAAHWVRNVRADPAVAIVAGGIRVEGRARVIAPDEPDDQRAREAIAAKYGTTGLKTWLRTSLPVAIDLEEVGATAEGTG